MTSNRNPTQWGSTAKLVGDVSTITLRKSSARLVDVRLPTTTEGWQSRDCTLYTFARVIETAIIEGAITTTAITCKLQTGMGGLTQKETFRMPGVGRAIHIVADSVRLDAEIPTDVQAAFEVSANVGTGGLYRHTTQIIVPLFPPSGGLDQYIDIPNYCVSYKIQCPNPSLITLNGAFDNITITTNVNGLSAVDFVPIPASANQIRIRSTINQSLYLTLLRPS